MKNSRVNYSISLLMAVVAVSLLSLPLSKGPRPSTAEACWTTLHIECFDSTRPAWPWCLPVGQGRCWRISPALPQLTWGIQDRIYSGRLQSFCGNDDDQSCWIIGGPGTEDPDAGDRYPANLNTFMTYGPLNLTNAQYAQVQFSLNFQHAQDVQDTICWGADSVFSLATTHIWIDSVFSGTTDEGWRTFTMDLRDLYRNNATRDSVSALGRPAVYVFWWFRADADQNRDVGAFVDDVIVAVDDGTVDIANDGISVRNPDGITFPGRIETGDYIRPLLSWRTCAGGVLYYPDFRATLYYDGTIILDTLMVGVAENSNFQWLLDSMMVGSDGDHEFQFVLDPLGQVTENNENNNTATTGFTSYPPNVPPTFIWVNPSSDTIRTAADNVVLSWQLFDPDGDATVTIRIDSDTTGCLGPIVPRAQNRPETEIPDTVNWSTSSIPDWSVRWPFAEYGDEFTLFCQYAPFPVLVVPLSSGERELVPIFFELAQNYPNPFNPETQISFSLTRAGKTTLRVYDITGREVATLIDNDLTPGFYETNFNAGVNRPSGVYLYRLDAPEGTITKKMILMK